MKKLPSSIPPGALALGLASAALIATSYVHAANPADWRPFNAAGPFAWSDTNAWTLGTGVPTSGTTLVINFDPSKAGTATTGGGISSNFTSTNDLGTVQLNTLNFSGSSNGSSRTLTLTGGTLQFGGANAAINNSTSGASFVNYTVASNILLDGDLSLNLNGTGTTTLNSAAGSSLSANSAGLKTVTISGAGAASIGNTSTSVISNNLGTVGITMAGTGLLTVGGANTFTGDLSIKAGTVALNSSSAGTATSFGAGTIRLGDTTGSANATLQLTKALTHNNNIIVQSNDGNKVIENTAGNSAIVLGGVITLNDDLTLRYTGGVAGGITTGTAATTTALTGTGNLTIENNGTSFMGITGSNGGFTGTVFLNSGSTRINSANGLSASNTVAVASGATLSLNNLNQTIGGLNNVAGNGGVVTNVGANARAITLGGSGTYTFGGTLTATTLANMGLTVNLAGAGKQILTGNSNYAGATTITAGTLLVNGNNSAATGTVSVNGGTLGGSGTIGGNTTIANNATLAPGASAGLLTFSGSLTFSGVDSKSVFEIASGSRGIDYDAINVGGMLTYNGDLTFAMTGLIANDTYNLYDFGSLGGSSFDTIAFGGVGNPYSGSFTNVAGVWTATSGGQTFTFTQATGELVVIPEPATSLLAGLGLTVLFYTARRNRRSSVRSS